MKKFFTTSMAVLAGASAFALIGSDSVARVFTTSPTQSRDRVISTVEKPRQLASGPMKAAQRDEFTGFPGNLVAPDAETLDAPLNTQEDFDRFTVFNEQDFVYDPDMWMYTAGKGWLFAEFSAVAAICNYANDYPDGPIYSGPYDCWLITPEMQMTAGERYVISFEAHTDGIFANRQTLQLMAGDSPTREAMTEKVTDVFTFLVFDEETGKCGFYFTPQRTGKYYIGFHVTTEPDKGGFGMWNLRISSPGAEVIPEEKDVQFAVTPLMDADLTCVKNDGEQYNDDGTIFMDAWPNQLSEEDRTGWLGNHIVAHAWEGLEVVNTLDNQNSNGAALIPRFVDVTGHDLVKYEVDYKLTDYAEQITGMDMILANILWSTGDLAPSAFHTGTLYTEDLMEGQSHTASWLLEVPQKPVMMYSAYQSGLEIGERTPTSVASFLQSYWNSNFMVTRVKVSGVKPMLDAPQGTRVENYTPTSATVVWDPVEDAEGYVVRFYKKTQCNGNEYTLSSFEQYRTTEPRIDLTFDEAFSAPIAHVFALGRNTRSLNTQVRVIDHAAPVLGEITELESGQMQVEWTCPANNVGTAVTVYKGVEVDKGTGFVAARLDMEQAEDFEGSTNYNFSEQEGSWVVAGGYVSVIDGAMVCENTAAPGDKLSIISNCAYDFSQARGSVYAKIVAKADNPGMASFDMTAPDDVTDYFETVAHRSIELGTDYRTYYLELPAADKVNLSLNFTGLGKVYFKELEITCDLPDGTIFYKPVETQRVASSGTGVFRFDAPAAPYTNILVRALNYRYENYDESTATRYVWSQHAVPALLEKTNGIGAIVTDREDASCAPVYYNLQGMPVANPVKGNLYIRVDGKSTTKVVY